MVFSKHFQPFEDQEILSASSVGIRTTVSTFSNHVNSLESILLFSVNHKHHQQTIKIKFEMQPFEAEGYINLQNSF